ncbi:MAG: nickel pincer cofactor biosynthesis protein LarC [Deltaproteobacteria bacterium]
MRIAYFDTGSGIAGDMTVAALLDVAGAWGRSDVTIEGLREALGAVAVDGYRIEASKVEVEGLEATRFDVVTEEGTEVPKRNWTEIRGLIEDAAGGGLGHDAAARALRVFEALARAEAHVHGVDVEQVHFHEVGAIDSIVDIVAACWCLSRLGIESCFCGPLPTGSGYVDTQHGRLPVPAPATVRLLEGFEVVAGDGSGEMVTPTGAAILAALARPLRPSFVLEASGSGAGSRRLSDRPNLLRVLVGQAEADSDEEVIVIETDIDDMTAEHLAYLAERLRGGGARDVTTTAVAMKKGRLGSRLTVLSGLGRMEELAALILNESSTIGLRFKTMARVVLPRTIENVDTDYGPVAVKVVTRPDGRRTAEPEFDDVARGALKHGVPFKTVREAALSKLKL